MRVLKTALLLTAATLPAVAHAEDGDTIIVSANRTQQSTSEVAQSVTVIKLDDIVRRQSVGVADLLRTVPGITVGGTDSKHYQAVVDNAYRFNPMMIGAEDLTGFHGINERLSVENLERAVRFYIELIRSEAR